MPTTPAPGVHPVDALLAWMMLVGLDSAELLEEGVGGRGGIGGDLVPREAARRAG